MDVQPDVLIYMSTICKACEHRTMLPNPQTRELTSYCTRHPPTVFGVATPNGIGLVTTYPPVSADHASCGEWELEIEEEPFNVEEPFNARKNPLAGTGGSPVD